MTQRYLEDFAVGQTFGSGTVTVETDHIKTFPADGNQQVSDPQLSRRRRGRLDAEPLEGEKARVDAAIALRVGAILFRRGAWSSRRQRGAAAGAGVAGANVGGSGARGMEARAT